MIKQTKCTSLQVHHVSCPTWMVFESAAAAVGWPDVGEMKQSKQRNSVTFEVIISDTTCDTRDLFFPCEWFLTSKQKGNFQREHRYFSVSRLQKCTQAGDHKQNKLCSAAQCTSHHKGCFPQRTTGGKLQAAWKMNKWKEVWVILIFQMISCIRNNCWEDHLP